ncbi:MULTISPECIES: MBL fold metallo-hydrolase [Methanosarcina]|jgi:ribonuclease BN (tRNA processing enzyme)|uniref:Arylsulfatase n=8 Tax=Methanosarcina mazei TaxID=2209 RepID=A0A0F8I7H8_METMZ|nr:MULTISPECIES: MBL fold metallo-hydrolase [Methanosarcina]AAM32637.1 metal dependent hydrolase [Methanosarcina mazei Go1]AKB40674.1 Metal dependent hydrolase [Methanosarcina mazei WWM610]AKB64964.1 Metal dependent hydrolase [Methanosarcina mazei S-6]AKB67979.1 Metal dependent hydrolase [Methanosarcina mazei LYC]AKB71242.1 Metal dependent hydrolase [Methanosarcina mazei C16]
MEITFLGTGVAIPQKGRVQSGVMVRLEEKPLLIDCGSGVLSRFPDAGILHTNVDTVLLSHLHLDHVADLIPLVKANWLRGKTDMRIYGPDGTEDWFSTVLGAYEYILDGVNVDVIELSPGKEFTPEGFDCEITCAAAAHSVPTLAYRVTAEDGEFVYSGDTEPCRDVMDLAVETDLLIHECSFPAGTKVTNHTTPVTLAEMLEEYNMEIGSICLTHFYPEMRGHEREAVHRLKGYGDGEIILAEDLMRLEL